MIFSYVKIMFVVWKRVDLAGGTRFPCIMQILSSSQYVLYPNTESLSGLCLRDRGCNEFNMLRIFFLPLQFFFSWRCLFLQSGVQRICLISVTSESSFCILRNLFFYSFTNLF